MVQDSMFIVCKVRISFSNDFACFIECYQEVTFDVKDEQEADTIVAWLQKQYHVSELATIVPLRLMRTNEVIKRYA